ncbi:MAG: hypothetical protein KZQ77_12540, partial [Candidatus Thiodiazotropha sp. (ex Notomyrtea botanica)]|nr:hypothetical protein [Candidatus Thiodiazotropha sp. (ex Notomyrtea botanica)]
VDPNDRQALLTVILFSRILSNVAASTVVIEIGYETQGRVLLRVAMESMFTLIAIEKHPELVDQFIHADELERKRMLNKARMWTMPTLKAQAELHATDEKLTKIQESIDELGARKISIEDYAKAAELHDWYLTAYSVFSASVHSNVRDLQKHFALSKDGEIAEILNEPILISLDRLYLSASEILLRSLESVTITFKLDISEFISRTTKRLELLANAIEG